MTVEQMALQRRLIAEAGALYAVLVRESFWARVEGNRGGEYRLYFAQEHAANRCTRRMLAIERMMQEAVQS